MCLIVGHGGDGDVVSAVFAVGLDHVGKAGCFGVMKHVRQEQCEGLVADDLPRAPDGMAQAKRRLLAREAGLPGQGEILAEFIERLGLAARLERVLEFVHAVEVVFDDALVAAGYENEVFDAGGARLVDDVLNDGAVDDCQHFLRHRLGRREEACSQTSDGENRLTDRLLRFRHDQTTPFIRQL